MQCMYLVPNSSYTPLVVVLKYVYMHNTQRLAQVYAYVSGVEFEIVWSILYHGVYDTLELFPNLPKKRSL